MAINVTKPSVNLREKLNELDFDKVPFQKMPAGSVLQVVNATTSTSVSNSTNTFVDTGLTATITPTSATSKILVVVHQNGGYKSLDHASNSIYTTLLRDAIVISSVSRYAGNTGTAINHYIESVSTSYLDSPATTSATTYKTQFRNHTASAIVSFQALGTPVSTITLMEIAQ
jgi:hypothetical protein